MRMNFKAALIFVAGLLATVGCTSGGGVATNNSNNGVGPNATTAGSPAPATSAPKGTTARPVPDKFKDATSELYSKDENWLCKPGNAKNVCLDENYDATAIKADGSTEMRKHTAAKDSPVDCFYVYPTINLEQTPGNEDADGR